MKRIDKWLRHRMKTAVVVLWMTACSSSVIEDPGQATQAQSNSNFKVYKIQLPECPPIDRNQERFAVAGDSASFKVKSIKETRQKMPTPTCEWLKNNETLGRCRVDIDRDILTIIDASIYEQPEFLKINMPPGYELEGLQTEGNILAAYRCTSFEIEDSIRSARRVVPKSAEGKYVVDFPVVCSPGFEEFSTFKIENTVSEKIVLKITGHYEDGREDNEVYALSGLGSKWEITADAGDLDHISITPADGYTASNRAFQALKISLYPDSGMVCVNDKYLRSLKVIE